MTIISANKSKNGLIIEHNDDLRRIVELQHVKPGKGSALVRSRLESLRTGAVQDYAFRSTEKVNTADTQTRPMQYLYNNGTNYVLMDMNTYEQFEIPNPEVERGPKFLKENMKINVITHESETLGIDLPNTVDLEVAEIESGIRGDTLSGGGKSTTMETSLVVNVPFFISTGDILTINISDGSHVSRANK